MPWPWRPAIAPYRRMLTTLAALECSKSMSRHTEAGCAQGRASMTLRPTCGSPMRYGSTRGGCRGRASRGNMTVLTRSGTSSALVLNALSGPDRVSNDLGATRGGFTLPFKDPERGREYKREWARQNRERLNAQNRAFRERNREKLLARAKEVYAERKTDAAWMEKRRQWTRAWRATPAGQEAIAQYREKVRPLELERTRLHARTHRQGYRANAKLRYAIRKGWIVRPDHCERCGATGRIEGAHHDYDRPLDVRWLCVSCHRAWDKAEPKLTHQVTEKIR